MDIAPAGFIVFGGDSTYIMGSTIALLGISALVSWVYGGLEFAIAPTSRPTSSPHPIAAEPPKKDSSNGSPD